MTDRLPLIGVVADVKLIEGQPFHAVGEKYLRAIAEAANCLPVIIPALSDVLDMNGVLEHLNGMFFTGSLSNVHPRYYDTEPSAEHEPFDLARDDLSLALIRATLAQEIPLLAVCRGHQELNVALGGTLHPAVHELPDRLDHRAPVSDDKDIQYGLRHEVEFVAGGEFAKLAGATTIKVNSLHRQAIDRLADALIVEGTGPDGTIEALRVRHARSFALSVQWHPEYQATQNTFSARLFAAFGEAARAHRQQT